MQVQQQIIIKNAPAKFHHVIALTHTQFDLLLLDRKKRHTKLIGQNPLMHLAPGNVFKDGMDILFISAINARRQVWVKMRNPKIDKLQNITEAEAKREGVELIGLNTWRDYGLPERDPETQNFIINPKINSAIKSFASLWNSIHSHHGQANENFTWHGNPQVLSFDFDTKFDSVVW